MLQWWIQKIYKDIFLERTKQNSIQIHESNLTEHKIIISHHLSCPFHILHTFIQHILSQGQQTTNKSTPS